MATPAPDISVPEPAPGSTVEGQLAQIDQAQPDTAFDAFTKAAQQELDPTFQAFKAASAQKIGQMQAPGEGLLPWQWGSRFAPSFWQHALETTAEMATGAERALANFFDPKALYSKQTDAQLQDGISQGQQRLTDLQKELGDNPDEYTYASYAWQAASLQNDITAMQKQLADRKGEARVPDIFEQFGGALRGDIGQTEEWLKGEQAKHPLNPVFEAGPAGRVAQLAGGIAPYIPLGELGAIPEMALGAGQAYEQTWQEGEHMGVDPTVANRAAAWSSAFMPAQIGAFRTVLAPFMSGMVGKTVRELLTDAAKNAGIGAGVGAGQTVWNNVVASASGIDPNRKITDGLAQSIVEQAGTMTALGMVTQAPSFALRAGSQPRIDAYKAPGAPEVQTRAQAPETAAAPEQPAAAAETEEQTRARLEQEALQGLARRDVSAPTPAPGGEPQPLARREINDELSSLRDRVGPRADFLLADERSLPLRYNKALADQGLNRTNFKAFFDRDTGDLVVNPKNISSREELNDIVNRNFIPNTFRGLANIVPVDSWHQVADNPEVAKLLAGDPNADTTTGGLYDPQSGTVFTNVSKINSGADPIGEGLSTAVHEISVHQGLRSQFGTDYPAFDRFLDRVWNGFQQTGTADQVATAAGARNLDELAKTYGLGTEQPDGTLTLSDREQRRLAEELLARYSERFDPAKLDKAPTVLQRAIGMVKDGLARFQGLAFTDDQAFRFIRDSWRGAEPPRSPEVNTGLLARRIIKTYEPPELERARANDPATRDIADAIGAIGGGAGRESLAAGSSHVGPGELAGASGRVGAYAASTGRSIDYGRLAERSALRVPLERDAEHEVHVPSGARDTVLKVTRPDGRWGPYGPGLERVPTQEQGLAPGDARRVAGGAYRLGSGTPESYLDRLALSNELFGAGNHLEGFTRTPGSDAWSIVSTQPRVTNFRPATPLEIADYMAGKGFHPVDERTYFDPERQVAVLDAHGGNVLADQATGRVHPVDVVPTRVDDEAAAHFQRIIEDPARLEAMKDHVDLDALQRQLGAKGIDLEAPRPPAAQMRMEDHFARDEDELADLRAKNAREGLSPEERQRMDDIEFGPLLKRDLELELGPESDPNEPAHRLLQRALETILTADPSYGVRVPALRTVLNDRDFMTAREFNASVSQLLYEKGGKAFWDRIVGKVYDEMGGDTERIINAVMGNAYPREINAQLYKHLWNDLADLRKDAIQRGDAAKQSAIEGARNLLDGWANEARTNWGKEGAAWQDVYFSAQGIMGKIRSDYDKVVRKAMQKFPEFAEAVKDVKFIRDSLTRSAAEDPGVKRIFDAAQRQHNFRLPAEYAKAIAEDLAKHFKGLSQTPADKPMLEQVFNRFKATIAAKIKENANIPMPDVKKLSASQRVIDALSNWKWFEDAWNQTINELKNAPDARPLFFQNVKDALDAPFSGSELSKVVREQGVSIGELFKQHRSRIGATIDSLSDFLSKRSNLSPEQSALVQRTVEGHIQSQVREKIQAEFDKILDRAQQKGKPIGGARAMSLERLRNLINMGAFEEKDVANALAPMYGFRGFTPEMSSRLTQLNDTLEKYRNDGRNGFQTEGIRQELLRTISEYARGSEQTGRYWIGLFTGNLMSGGPTHVGAFASEFMQGMTNLVTQLPWNRPAEVVPSFLQAINALGKGMGQAVTDHSQYLWATGKDPALFRTEESLQDESSKIYTPNIFEAAPTQRALQKIGMGPAAAIGKIIDVPYRQLFRTVSLLHNLIYSGFGRSTEMLAALRVARDRGMSFDEGRDWANDMMYADQGSREAYAQQAANEGLGGAPARIRVQELIDQGQADEPDWQVDARKSILAQADRWGTRANFMQDPEGVLGLASHYLQQLGQKIPFMRQYFPFTRIPTNLINETLNLTPVGLIRYWKAEPYFTRFNTVKIEPEVLDELKANLLARSLIGTTGTLALAIAAATLKDQNGNPLFQIHGAGPTQGTTSGKQLYYQLLDGGWKPHSIEFGGHYYPFEFTPVFGALDAIGNFYDTQRYSDMPSATEAVQQTTLASIHGLLERGSLTGVHDLLDLLTNTKSGPAEMQNGLDKQFANWKNFIPLAGANLAKQTYQEFIDNRLYQGKGPAAFARDIPFAASAIGMKPLLNFFGEPVRMYPWARIVGQQESPDPIWKFLDRNDISLTKPSARAMINGKRIKEDDNMFYNYTGFRGAELHRLLTLSLSSLEKIRDPDALDKTIKKLESRADLYAKGQLIQGHQYEVPR
jgi:hypothetical protein